MELCFSVNIHVNSFQLVWQIKTLAKLIFNKYLSQFYEAENFNPTDTISFFSDICI